MVKSSHNLERQSPILTRIGLSLCPNLRGIFLGKNGILREWALYLRHNQTLIKVMKNQNRKGMSYRKLNSSAKLAVINSRMRRGDVGRVAKATGFSASFTSEVLSAKKSNDRIVNKAYDMTRGRMRNSVKG